MTKKEFQKLTKTITLLDGATGSNLMAQGMPRGVCTEAWVIEHKDIILNLQKNYVEAGSRILYAPTFGANRLSLRQHGLEEEIARFNHTLVSYAKEAAGDRAFVAGDITTSGQFLSSDGDYTYESAFENYCEQIRLLSQAGADCIIAETMIDLDETLAVVDAANTVCDLPILCSLTVESDGSVYRGGNILEAAASLEAAGADAVGINCSVGPDQLISVVKNLCETVSIPVIAKPNAGMPFIDDQGQAHYSMGAEEFARHMKVLADCGALLLGGCCGTTPEYIRETAKILGLH